MRSLGVVALAGCCLLGACDDQKPSPAAGAPPAGSGETVAASRCYRSDGPILSRLAPERPESAPAGWLRLDGARNAAAGAAQLVETGGASLGARWTRNGDTLVVTAADDFLQVTLRLVDAGGTLRGDAHAFSDAQLERAPDGRLVPTERRWRMVADSTDCGAAPTAWTGTGQTLFDPERLRTGDSVGPFRAASVDVAWAEAVQEWTGSVSFEGNVRLRGTTLRHPAYPEVTAACFEADPASARRLPRWPGDERRPWFCFENDSAARRMLGAPESPVRAEIVIDRFTTVRAFTDAVNSARLVSATAGAPVSAPASASAPARPAS